MSELAAHETDYDVVAGEPPELMGRNLTSAAHLVASATAFFFLAFFFAYFYLRSLNNAHLWQPKDVEPSITLGTLVMALTVLSAVLLRLGVADQRAGRRSEWRLKGAVAFGVGVGAIVLQVVEWFTVDFGPANGGYASVFFGWTAFNVLFIAGTLLWLENLLATAIRYRTISVGDTPAPGHASGDPGRLEHDVADPLSLLRPGLEALSFYWTFLAGLGVLAWIVLYLI
jgi:heme/copper-type cytochrome/quinol oxidase subunit 3